MKKSKGNINYRVAGICHIVSEGEKGGTVAMDKWNIWETKQKGGSLFIPVAYPGFIERYSV